MVDSVNMWVCGLLYYTLCILCIYSTCTQNNCILTYTFKFMHIYFKYMYMYVLYRQKNFLLLCLFPNVFGFTHYLCSSGDWVAVDTPRWCSGGALKDHALSWSGRVQNKGLPSCIRSEWVERSCKSIPLSSLAVDQCVMSNSLDFLKAPFCE